MRKDVPQRSCISCRQVFDKQKLLRFVLAPDRTLVPDLQQKLPGRGLYTCVKASCLLHAAQKKQFSRGFKGDVLGAEPDKLIRVIKDKLLERIAAYISLANKGRKVVSGSDQVLDRLKNGGVGLLFLATDISVDIGEKFRGVARLNGVVCEALFTKEKLGDLIGKELRSVLALLESGFIGSISSEIERYRNFFEEERE